MLLPPKLGLFYIGVPNALPYVHLPELEKALLLALALEHYSSERTLSKVHGHGHGPMLDWDATYPESVTATSGSGTK